MEGGGISDIRGAEYYLYDADAESMTISYNNTAQYGRPLDKYIVMSVAAPNITYRPGFLSPHRAKMTNIMNMVGYSQTFDGIEPISSASHPSLFSRQVADSILGEYSAEWVIPAGLLTIITDPNKTKVEQNKFYVWTIAVRWLSGDATI
ncbi:hypothetical protein ACFSFZ_14915 [Mixta tenebrionis]|uniref:Uncharacterized protein n=1 Tax=Mixta tenebrionis TaxID=2562439 RepID=A0A506VBF4_9GAMM|nr:hypothetical protein [Mixta tenebrionis]TPW43291.1 hypothetical protein FKM52_06950 [Mixta tenebrionis]